MPMSIWIWLAVIAQIIYAVVSILDKSLVTSKTILHPFSYAFYVSILSTLSVFIFFLSWVPIPFGLDLPSFTNLVVPTFSLIVLCLVSGLLMFIALVNLYEAFSKSDASDVVPVVSSIGAVGILVLEFWLLSERYSIYTLTGILLLIAGTFLVSNFRFNKEVILHTLYSGLAFAFYYTLIKIIFGFVNFDSGFLYSRLGLVSAGLIVIMIPSYRRRIFRKLDNKKVKKLQAGAYVLGLKALAGVASIMTLKAIELGSVAVVQSLAGVQFLVLIFFSVGLGNLTPNYFGENDLKPAEIFHKVIAACVIATGLYFAFM